MRRRGAPAISTAATPTSAAPRRIKRADDKSSLEFTAFLSTVTTFFAVLLVIFFLYQYDDHKSHDNDQVGKGGGGGAGAILLRQSNSDQLTPSQGLIIHTHLGDIRIHFTPELSGESSIKYIEDVVHVAAAKQHDEILHGADGRRITEGFSCEKCKFYRVESHFLLEGVMADPSVPKNDILGPCPIANWQKPKNCEDNDPNCHCHGPIMTKGMVGWAHGRGGPDFFINTSEKSVDWWKGSHTVWGEIRDEESLEVVESAYELPIDVKRTIKSGTKMLEEEIEFSLELF